MPQGNVELIQKAFAAFGTGGFEAMQPFLAPDFVWHTAQGWVEEADYRGIDAFRDFIADWADGFEGFAFEARDSRAIDDGVLVCIHVHGRGRDSGAEIDWDFGVVFSEFRDGKVGDARASMTWTDALRAVGLAE